MRAMIAAAAFVAATGFNIPAGYAFGDAPWCAVKNFGSDVVWDCQYRYSRRLHAARDRRRPQLLQSQSVAGAAGAARRSSQAPGGSAENPELQVVKFAFRNLLPAKHIADCKRRVNAIV